MFCAFDAALTAIAAATAASIAFCVVSSTVDCAVTGGTFLFLRRTASTMAATIASIGRAMMHTVNIEIAEMIKVKWDYGV